MPANTLSLKARERKAGRYTVAGAVAVKDADGFVIGRVGVGSDRKGESSLVWESGQSQTGVPLDAVAQSLVSVFGTDSIAALFMEAGKGEQLVKAIEKAQA